MGAVDMTDQEQNGACTSCDGFDSLNAAVLSYIFFLPSHLFPEFDGRLTTPGILPERLNRGHTEGSSP